MVMKQNKILKISAAAFIAAAISFTPGIAADAASAETYFGSTSYSTESGKTFPIGVYLGSDDGTIGSYTITLTYDADVLQYVDGGVSGGGGSITVEGDASARTVKNMLHFVALKPGDTSLAVTGVSAHESGEDGAIMTVTKLSTAPIKIGGEAVVEPEETTPTESQTPNAGAEGTGSADGDGSESAAGDGSEAGAEGTEGSSEELTGMDGDSSETPVEATAPAEEELPEVIEESPDAILATNPETPAELATPEVSISEEAQQATVEIETHNQSQFRKGLILLGIMFFLMIGGVLFFTLVFRSSRRRHGLFVPNRKDRPSGSGYYGDYASGENGVKYDFEFEVIPEDEESSAVDSARTQSLMEFEETEHQIEHEGVQTKGWVLENPFEDSMD